MKILLGIIAAALVFAADPAGYTLYSSKQLTDKGQELHGKMDAGLASEKIGDWGNHQVMAAHREADGQAEFHENQADVLMIRSGQCSIVLGGRIVGGKTTAPGEIRGDRIEGGETREFKAGDVLHIAPKTPHQMIVKKGVKLDYVAVKIDAK